MGGAGFGQGLVQGLEQAKNRQMEMAQLKLQQEFAKSRQKAMESEDQLKQLQMQSLMEKIAAEQRLPSMQANLMGPEAAPLGAGDQGPMPEAAPPEIDRRKLLSFLQVGQQAGQDPNQLLDLMGMADPRIRAIADTMRPKKFEKLAPGEKLINPQSGEEVAKGGPKEHVLAPGSTLYREGDTPIQAPDKPEKQKPIVASPGQTIVMPDGTQFVIPAAPQKPVTVGEGQQLVDPETGKVIHEGPAKQEKPVVVGQGQSVVEPSTGKEIFKAPEAPVKPVSVASGGSLVNPQTGEAVFTAPAAPPKPPDFGDRIESAAAIYMKHTYGIDGGTMTALINKDPIAAEKVRKQAMVDEPVKIAGAKAAALQKEDEGKMLSPTEANTLGVEFGTTKGQAKGIMPMTAQQREALAGFDSARVMIQDIKQYSEKVNQAAGGLMGRGQQSMKLWGAWTQSDPDAAMLQSKGGELARLARSMGEKGAMAEGDIARAAALVPSILDTREVAAQKLKDLTVIIEQAEVNFRKSLGAMKSGGQPAKPQSKAPKPDDPYAYIAVPPGLTKQQADAYKQAYHAERMKKQQQMQGGSRGKPE